MLALKKKREAEAKAAAESPPAEEPPKSGKVSLLGIGGKKKTKSSENGTKKRSPGEIRIQKGECVQNVLKATTRVVGMALGRCLRRLEPQ